MMSLYETLEMNWAIQVKQKKFSLKPKIKEKGKRSLSSSLISFKSDLDSENDQGDWGKLV